jgi:hypothetical protein
MSMHFRLSRACSNRVNSSLPNSLLLSNSHVIRIPEVFLKTFTSYRVKSLPIFKRYRNFISELILINQILNNRPCFQISIYFPALLAHFLTWTATFDSADHLLRNTDKNNGYSFLQFFPVKYASYKATPCKQFLGLMQ